MNKPAYNTHENTPDSLILIVDKIGVIGEALAREFSKDFHVVFVTRRPLSEKNERVSQILFKTKIPKVPQNKYSKIFLIDDGDSVTRESAFSFISRSKQTSTYFYFLGSLRNFDVEHADEISRSYTRTKVLIFGDLFDKEILFDKNASITKFIVEAKNEKKIKVPNEGLALNYPVSFEDTIKLIVRATYIDIPERTILLFYRHGITDISLAHMFQKIDPEMDVDFTSEKIEQGIYIPAESSYALSKYDIKKKLEELGLEKEIKGIKIGRANKNIDLKYFKFIVFFFLACLFLFFLPLITTESYIFLGFNQIESAKNLAEEGDFEKALKKSNNAKTFFTIAKKTGDPLTTQAKLLGLEDRAEKLETRTETGENLSNTTSNLLSGSILLKNVVSGKSADPNKDFREGLDSLKSAYLTIQKVKTQGQIPSDIEKSLDNILPFLDLVSNTSDVMPKAMGFGQQKKYLVVFQDSTKIRPGGGEISAVGKLTLSNGKVEKFEVADSSTLDEKLKTHIEPPYPIRRYVPSEHFYLKDAGFDPDFINSAITAASIYKLETKDGVDGVIALDLSVAKKLLSEGDKVTVQGAKADPDNLYQVVSDNSLRNGFYSQFIKELITNLSNKKEKANLNLPEIIGKGILEKHILFAFKDPDIQSVFSANNLSGALIDDRKNKEDSINDFIGISEANLGRSSNNFISRSLSKEVKVGSTGDFSSIAILAFKNSGTQEYKNYLQLILPQGSKIQDISVGGKNVNTTPAVTDFLVYERKGFSPPDDLEIEQRSEDGKSIFGFFVISPPDSVTTIKINYSLPFKLSSNTKSTRYSLVVYKQPGIDSFPFDLTFNLPNGALIFPRDSFSGEIRKDTELIFFISQK